MKYYKIKYILILFYYFILILNKKINININKNYENNLNGYNYISKLKKVVYTVLIGNYDEFHTINKEKGYDYFMLTDQKLENSSMLNWTILRIKNTKNLSTKKKFKAQRFYKINPHLFFKNYDLSIYIDTTYEIKGNLDDFLLRILSPNLSIYVLEHPKRNSIYKEMKAVINCKKDSKSLITIIKNKYKNQHFSDNNGLSENCLIIRKHNEINCINFMEQWYNEVNKYSHRDQLSFCYILWKTRYKIVKYISKQFSNEYFHQYEFHLKSFNFK